MKKICFLFVLCLLTSCATLVQDENGLYSEFSNKKEDVSNVRYNSYGLVIVKYKRKPKVREQVVVAKYKNRMNGKVYKTTFKGIHIENERVNEKNKKSTFEKSVVENPR